MRIRTIKPEFFLHEGLFELEQETSLPARLAFAGLWCIADREGRFKWEPRKIGVQVMPYDCIDFSRVLHALTTRGFVVKYTVDSVEYGCIPSFPRHQVINNRERDSELPEPTESNICDASTTREARVATRDQPCKEEGKGKEGNKEQGKEGILSFSLDDANPVEKPKPTVSPEVLRIGRILNQGRRPTTLLTDSESKAFKQCDFTEDEICLVEAFYLYSERPNEPLHRRTGLLSLLNHWADEVGKARAWAKKYGYRPTTPKNNEPLPEGYK